MVQWQTLSAAEYAQCSLKVIIDIFQIRAQFLHLFNLYGWYFCEAMKVC